MTCFVAVEALSPIVAFALDLLAFAVAFALRIRSQLH